MVSAFGLYTSIILYISCFGHPTKTFTTCQNIRIVWLKSNPTNSSVNWWNTYNDVIYIYLKIPCPTACPIKLTFSQPPLKIKFSEHNWNYEISQYVNRGSTCLFLFLVVAQNTTDPFRKPGFGFITWWVKTWRNSNNKIWDLNQQKWGVNQ